MPKRLSKARKATNAKKKAWKIAVREAWDDRCAICFRENNLDCHHMTYRKELKWDYRIGVVLCKKHHKLGHCSAHTEGILFHEELKRLHPKFYAEVLSLIKEQE